MSKYKPESSLCAATNLVFNQVAMAYRLGRLDRATAARLTGCTEDVFDARVEALVDAIQGAPWEDLKPYRCDVCGDHHDGMDVIGFCLPEDAEDSLGFLPAVEAPRHVCQRCLGSFYALYDKILNLDEGEEGQGEEAR